MYATLLILHSLFRWLVLLTLVYAIYRAARGYRGGKPFSALDNSVRHWTATTAHLQLVIGVLLYVKSPLVGVFYDDVAAQLSDLSVSFLGFYHGLLMLTAIVVLTVGSARAKRVADDRQKFRTMLAWFSVALLLILIAIPWPFSPLSHRPYIRTF